MLEEDLSQLIARCRQNSDIPISPSERSHLQTRVEDHQRELGECDKDIGQLTTTRRAQLTRAIDCQSSLLSPIRRLPMEIMFMIFNAAVQDRTIYFSDDQTQAQTPTAPKLRGTIFPLTWVCAWWRNPLIADGSFWYSYRIHLNDSDFISHNQSFFVTACLSRAFRCTLSINLALLTHDDYFSPAHSNILEVLLAISDSWDSFTIKLDGSLGDMRQVRSRCVVSSAVPYLQYVDVDFGEVDGISDLDDCWDAVFGTTFAECPRLDTLHTTHLGPHDTVDLSRLTQLVTNTYDGTITSLLKRCPALRTLTVRNPDFATYDPDPEITDLLLHTNLEQILMSVWDDAEANGTWEFVRFPNLKSLAVVSIRLEDEPRNEAHATLGSSLGEFKSMLMHSKCILRAVHIDDDLKEWFLDGLSTDLINRA
ncbi:hypothetical protein EV361DRAFT_964243 [Lentinula raphanica]|nr:hypothetical protein EV361DRAFT_964243 [Lentinula raphanica]